MGRFSILLCLAIGCGGDNNGGWNTAAGAPSLMNALRVWAFSPTNVWVLDGTANIHVFDGKAWSELATPSTDGLTCVYALSETDAYLCTNSSVLHYDGTTFTASDVQTPTGLSGLTALWASSDTDLWVVGMDAIVAHYNGTSWQRTIVGEPNKGSIWGSSPSDIYALGVFGLDHYDGSTWTGITLDSGGGDGQVWGTSATDVWAMTDSSQVSHFDGTKWTTSDLNLIGELGAVWGAAPNDVWGAGNGGAVAHWDGSSWTEVRAQDIGSPYLQQLLSVHGSSSKDVWTVGHQLGQGGSTALIWHHGG